jgi:hypothetical protein
MEAVGSPDMLLPIYQTRQHYIAEDHNQCHIPEDYKTDTHSPGNLNLRYIMLLMLVSAKQGDRTDIAFFIPISFAVSEECKVQLRIS